MSLADIPPTPEAAPLDELAQGIAEVLDGFGESFAFFDQDWRIRHLNRSAENLFTREQALGRVVWELIPRVLGTPLEPALRRAMAERVSIQVELPSVLRPGLTNAIRIFPVGLGLGLSYRDITDDNALRDRERQQAQRLDLLIAASGLGDWTWDTATGLVTLSERASVIYGLSPLTEVSDATFRATGHPDDSAKVSAAIKAGLRSGEFHELEHRLRRPPHGEEVWIMVSGRAQYNAAGRIVSMFGVVADITRMKTQELKIRESEARFRAFANSAPAPLWVTDPAGKIEFVNQAVADFNGVPADAHVARDVPALRVHPDDLPELLRTRTETLPEQLPHAAEFRFLNVHDEWRSMRILSKPRYDEVGGFVGHIGMAMDVTEIREAESRQRLLINELNHRVKNTLATIQSIAQQTLRDGLDPAAARETFVDRLLALSAAHNVLTRERWEGADLLEIAAQAVRPYDEPNGSRIHIHGPNVRLAPQVAVGLSMALHELATNAAKYGALCGPCGHITLAWRLAQDGSVVDLRWRERGGPLVRPPSRRGFGARLLTRGLAAELGRPAQLDYRPEGMVCTLHAPVVQWRAPGEPGLAAD